MEFRLIGFGFVAPVLVCAFFGLIFGYIAAALFGGRKPHESFALAIKRQKRIVGMTTSVFALIGLIYNIYLFRNTPWIQTIWHALIP